MLITLTGTSPLLMHNERLANPYDQYTRDIKAITGKRTNKTEEDIFEMGRLEFAGSLYHDEKLGPYLPGNNLVRALRNTGNLVKKNKGGKEIERGFLLMTDRAPLEYIGPRNVDSLWDDGYTEFVDRRLVRVTGGKVLRTRAVFAQWSATFEFELDSEQINLSEFITYAERAGKVEGVGTGRRIFYGRFTAEVTK